MAKTTPAQLAAGTAVADIRALDFANLMALRDQNAKWTLEAWEYLEEKSASIVWGYEKAGTLQVEHSALSTWWYMWLIAV